MTRLILAACLVGVFSSTGRPLSAQEEASLEPQVRMVQTGANRLLKDLEAVMSLTNAKEQKQTQVIKDYLDVFLVGVDKTRLVRMDWIFGEGPVRYRPAIPVNPQNEQIFWKQNLIPNGINKKRRIAKTLYSTTGTFKGYMRFRDNYAIFAEKLEDLPPLAPPPERGVAHLLKYTDNAAIELTNVSQGVEQRHVSFNGDNGLRKQLTKDMIKTKTESQDAFDLRKLTFGQQLDELERIYAEAAYSRLVAKFDPAKKIGELDFVLTPLANTPLAGSIQNLNQAPLSFANVPKAPQSNMSLRVRLPLDEMRQKHLTDTFELLRKIAHNDADKNTKKTQAQKDATEEVIDLSFKFLIDNVKTGMADGFFEAHPHSNGTNTAVGAFKAVNANSTVDILKLLEKTRDGQKVQLNLAQEGGVNIHSFLISQEQFPGLKDFFGGYEIYIGTSPDALWFGAGTNAVEEMKAAIREVAKPNTGQAADPFLTMSGRAAPWLELEAKSRPDAGGEQFKKYRRLMIEAGQPGDDQFAAWFNRQGDNVVGQWKAAPGWIRFLGKYLADFSEENLQE